jgi:hypothetical protein
VDAFEGFWQKKTFKEYYKQDMAQNADLGILLLVIATGQFHIRGSADAHPSPDDQGLKPTER